MTLPNEPISPSTVVFRSSLVTVGKFRCPPQHERWRTENVIPESGPQIVFPRVPVVIHQRGHSSVWGAVTADTNSVMLYNPGERYTRRQLSPHGDRCEWFCFDPGVFSAPARGDDPSGSGSADRLFSAPIGPCSPNQYRLQRRVFELAADPHADALAVDEAAMELLHAMRPSLGSRPGSTVRADTARSHADAVEAAKEYLASRFTGPLRLRDIARAAHCSPYHFCRIFRVHTGLAVRQYVRQLRVVAAFNCLRERDARSFGPLSSLAAELGFASQTHLSSAFRKAFGTPPSAWSKHAPESPA